MMLKENGVKWSDKILASAMASSDEICIRMPSAAVGSKEQRILKSSFLGGISTSDIAEGSNQYFTNSRALSAVGKTNNSIGFSLAGGATSRTLTITDDSTIDQNLASSNAPTFAGLTATGSINANYGNGLTASTGISLWSSTDYRIGFESNGSTRGWMRFNVDTADAIHGWAFTAGSISGSLSAAAIIQGNSNFILGANAQNITAQAALHVAEGGYFGTSILAQSTITANGSIMGQSGWLSGVFGASASGNKVVMGLLNGQASIGAHNFGLSAWANLYIMPEAQANVGIGLSVVASETPNATLHSGGGTIVGAANSAVSDSLIYPSQVNVWLDETNNILNFKAKNSTSSITTFGVTKFDASNYKTTIATTTYSATAADFAILADTTLGGFTITVDATKINTEQVIMYYLGMGTLTITPAASQFINNSSSSITLTAPGQFVRLTSNGLLNMYASGSNDSYRTLTSNGSNLATDKVILLDSTSGNVNLTVDVTKLASPLRVIRVSATGTNTTGYQATGGQTINGLSSSITMATKYSTSEITYIGGTAGCITASAVG